MKNKIRDVEIYDFVSRSYIIVKSSLLGSIFRRIKKQYNLTTEEYYKLYLLKPGEGFCKICNNPTSFRGIQDGYSKYCSSSCANLDPETLTKKTKTYLDKTGYTHNSLNPENIKKVKSTCLEKYGVDHHSKSKETKSKIEKTCLTKYGSKSFLSSNDMKKIIKDKFGVDNVLQNKDIISKIQSKNKQIFDHRFLNSFFPSNYLLLDIDKDNVEYLCDKNHHCTSSRQLIYKRFVNKSICCQECNPIYSFTSTQGENGLYEFISSIYSGEIIRNYREHDLELDIYIPEFKLGFEYNGLYWHSNLHKQKNYHQYKTEYFLEHGIKVIHIFEDDYLYKLDIVKSRIKNLLGKNEVSIHARKCVIREVKNSEYRKFIEENHIQGFVNAKVKIGLYYKDELVSVMSFSVPRMNKKYEYELLRFCNKLNSNVVGGASRLLKYFIKKYNPSSIISYADRSWSTGNVYEKLGFRFIENTCPNYYYIEDGIRQNRFKFRKSELVKSGYDSNLTEEQIMISKNIFRIYDSGSKVYVWFDK